MNGALDEWLSHRSAKPSTAVRIRQAPHLRKISTTPADIFLFYSQQVFLQMWAQRKIWNISTWWGTCGGTWWGTWWGCKFFFMCFCCSYIHQIWFSLGTFRSSVEISWGNGFPKESVLFLLTFEAKDENIWGKRWECLRESWLTFEGNEFSFLLPAEIVAYGTRAVSWHMFSPLSVTKWPTYHTIPSKFASNREILFCPNEPKKRKKASELGVKTWNLRPLSIVIWCILCPLQALELWSHVSDNIVTHCKSA